MPNIKFSYLYRDSSNYKKYGYIIFENPDRVALAGLEKLIRSKLIDDTWFYPKQWGLPNLILDTFNFEIDPTWHEFESIVQSNELPTSNCSLAGFMKKIVAIQV